MERLQGTNKDPSALFDALGETYGLVTTVPMTQAHLALTVQTRGHMRLTRGDVFHRGQVLGERLEDPDLRYFYQFKLGSCTDRY